jgi:hypothetical protein
LAVPDWSSSPATDDGFSSGEDEDYTNTTDPLALHSQEVLGESEEEAKRGKAMHGHSEGGKH